MANTSVFTGADGTITLSVPSGAEGDKAKDVLGKYDITTVGRVQNVRVEVAAAVRAFNEIGQRYATELRPGNVSVRGSIGRAYVNGAMIRLLLGDAADKRPGGSWVQPACNVTLVVENPAIPGKRNTVTLHDVKFDTWAYDMPEDDFLMEQVTFQALFLSVEDEG
jgi:hypothetical protein